MTSPSTLSPRSSATAPSSSPSKWTAGRTISVVVGSLFALIALGLVAAGGIATWLTNTQRDAAGYISTHSRVVSTAGYAITSDRIDLGTGADLVTPGDVLGNVRIRATSTNATNPIFIGVAPSANVESYLRGVSRQVITDWTPFSTGYREQAGAAPSIAPTKAAIWTATAAGVGTQSLTWRASTGDWTVVIMQANGQPGIAVKTDIGATLPDLGWYALAFFVSGGVLLTVAAVMIAIPVARASR